MKQYYEKGDTLTIRHHGVDYELEIKEEADGFYGSVRHKFKDALLRAIIPNYYYCSSKISAWVGNGAEYKACGVWPYSNLRDLNRLIWKLQEAAEPEKPNLVLKVGDVIKYYGDECVIASGPDKEGHHHAIMAANDIWYQPSSSDKTYEELKFVTFYKQYINPEKTEHIEFIRHDEKAAEFFKSFLSQGDK